MIGRVTAVVATLLLAPAVSAQQWPSFRGESASGVADGQHPPLVWDGQTGHHVGWRRPIPGLGHSSPVLWGRRLFVTTAVAPGHDPYLRPGLYGESPENPEDWVHEFRVLCLDKATGEVLWERVATVGRPKIPRHVKSSHATPSAATDGERVVVSFGSEGLFALDMDGGLLWKVDLGLLDSGAFDAPEIRWGYGSSPVIYQGRVLVLCDVNNQSFLAAFDVETGRELWRTLRDEGPTWGTPTVHGSQVIVNGHRHRGGYDLATGAERWRMHGGGDIPIPTPVVADGLAFFSSAHGPERPLVAVRLEARGDVSLAEGEASNRFVAWSLPRRGAYLPTPIVYRGELYVVDDRGVLSTYRAETGEQIYRTRLGGSGGAHSSSPVAADGNVYFTSEECEIHVVEAGPTFRLVATNRVPGVCLASPALSEGTFFLRTSTELWALRDQDPPASAGSVEGHHLLDEGRLEQAGPRAVGPELEDRAAVGEEDAAVAAEIEVADAVGDDVPSGPGPPPPPARADDRQAGHGRPPSGTVILPEAPEGPSAAATASPAPDGAAAAPCVAAPRADRRQWDPADR